MFADDRDATRQIALAMADGERFIANKDVETIDEAYRHGQGDVAAG